MVLGAVTNPRETWIVTVEPCPTFEPACGLCASTVPADFFEITLVVCTWKPSARNALTAAASRLPTTFGTASDWTAETVRVTTVSLTTSAPGFGSCATTVPASAELERVTVRAIRPRAFSRCTASRCCRRTTLGTLTVEAPLSPSSRVSSQAATRPPITSASRSSNHGHSSGRRGGGPGGGGPISSSTTTGWPPSTTVASSEEWTRRRLTSASYPFVRNTEPVTEEIFAIHPKTPNARLVY
jgi:hypothetical protein